MKAMNPPNMDFSYYCEWATEKEYQTCLVESYQLGNLIQCRLTQSIEYARQFVEITDKEEIKRLGAIMRRI
jgi:hypothetical protein